MTPVHRDLFLGFMKVHVLHHAALEPVYGLAIIDELQRHGYEVSPGTLYPALHGMEEDGLLEREERVVDGRVRKYYRATPGGRRALEKARDMIRELVEEVLEGRGPARLPEPGADSGAGADEGRPRAGGGDKEEGGDR